MSKLKDTGMNSHLISSHIHCGQCLDELPVGQSPIEYQDLSVGFTAYGIQVWCKRHNCNIMHVDFEGAKHPADCTAKTCKP